MGRVPRKILTAVLACLQEAISCWAHLLAAVLGDENNAAAEGMVDLLVTPVMQKLAGSGAGLAAATGCTPSASQAIKLNTPFPPELEPEVYHFYCVELLICQSVTPMHASPWISDNVANESN